MKKLSFYLYIYLSLSIYLGPGAKKPGEGGSAQASDKLELAKKLASKIKIKDPRDNTQQVFFRC